MGNIFAGAEIVMMGIQIEKNGRDFYQTLVKQSKSKKAKEIFDYLAAEEKKHIVVFEKILDSVKKYEPPESYPGEYDAYMKALAGDYVFTQENKGEDIAKKTKNDKEAVEVGIKFEKDSVVFCESMRKVVPKYDHRTLDELIIQELGHLRQLYKLEETL